MKTTFIYTSKGYFRSFKVFSPTMAEFSVLADVNSSTIAPLLLRNIVEKEHHSYTITFERWDLDGPAEWQAGVFSTGGPLLWLAPSGP